MIPPFLAPYAKSVTATVTALIGWGMVVASSASGPVTASEWLGLAVALAGAFGVYAVPNSGRSASGIVVNLSPEIVERLRLMAAEED